MEVAVGKTLWLGLNPKIISCKQEKGIFVSNTFCRRACFPPRIRYRTLKFHGRKRHEYLRPAHAISSDVEDVGVSSQFEDFTVTPCSTEESRKLKIRVEVSGAKTRAIFNEVFDKMVADAQPIPGFRRVKGGKTPNIPREILLEVLGASKVYKQVITRVINSTVSEYAEKESLSVGKDLRVEQSIEDLEEIFEPDEIFSFDAVIQLQQSN
ncbi:hypothetical protein ERO13_D02G109300v2 [Gossypium hirsutum]|uniref:peptidylprolyl isomerase n=2 Tax=Gossypium TaxID=3633 RepID=A0A1U8JTF7_GOSHI|nr:trigger factor-like [Gossypium hirsutum]KAG4158250.1 hypothetical protein ERO13_D02G109300v2 [Gossypium hirsutum]TYH83539.1 hypothetical protein ES332_D02G139200v1 [Gossypium tomentosum]